VYGLAPHPPFGHTDEERRLGDRDFAGPFIAHSDGDRVNYHGILFSVFTGIIP